MHLHFPHIAELLLLAVVVVGVLPHLKRQFLVIVILDLPLLQEIHISHFPPIFIIDSISIIDKQLLVVVVAQQLLFKTLDSLLLALLRVLLSYCVGGHQ